MTHYISEIYIFKSVLNRSHSPHRVQQISETLHRPWTPNLIPGYIRELGAFSRIVIPQRTFMSPPRFWVSIDVTEGGGGSRSHHGGVEGQHREREPTEERGLHVLSSES
jgi:hypothetical protein